MWTGYPTFCWGLNVFCIKSKTVQKLMEHKLKGLNFMFSQEVSTYYLYTVRYVVLKYESMNNFTILKNWLLS